MDWQYIYDTLPALMAGLGMTLTVSGVAILASLLIGAIGAALRTSGIRWVEGLVTAYVEFVRGTPYLVQIFFIFYGLPAIGLTLSMFWSGAAALTLWASAFQIENLRAGLLSVSQGTKDASASLGLRWRHHVLLVVAPIALRASLPSVMNTIVATVKNSAYLETIGLVELTFVAISHVALEFRAVEMFSAICVIYLICVLVISALGQWLERELNRPYGGR